MSLSHFSLDHTLEPTIKFSVNISYVFYKASVDIEDYKICFKTFNKELELFYDNKIEMAQLILVGKQLEIYFKQLDFGHILVTIKLNHFDIDYITCISTLVIQYEIDQSFIPDLITEINAILTM